MGYFRKPLDRRAARHDGNGGSKRLWSRRPLLARGLVTISVLGGTALSFGLLGSTPAAPDTAAPNATTSQGNSGNTGAAGNTGTTGDTTTTTAPTTTTTTAPPATTDPTTTTTTTAVTATSGAIAGVNGDTSPKVTICHSTDSASNPWVIETVDENSILQGGHGKNGINDDDIIPPFTDGADGTYPGNNYAGDAVWSGHGANKSFTATETGQQILANECNYFRDPTNVSTTVDDGTTNKKWSGHEITGATAYDTSTITSELVSGPEAGPSATPITPLVTGTVTYTFFTNLSCQGDNGTQETVNIVTPGKLPNSPTTLPLAAGSYSYEVTYNGDAVYAPSTGDCEPFSVGPAPTSSATVLDDAATNAQWSGNETTGAQAYDTSTVSGEQGGIAPTGTVTYTLFDNLTCTPPIQDDASAHVILSTQTVTLNHDGTVPNSATTSPLTPGDYSFHASYSGDSNYDPSGLSPCEPFSVKDGPTTTATVLKDAGTGQNWAGTEAPGATAYDTSTVSGEVGGIVPTGTVTYSYFTNGNCNGTPVSTQKVTLNGDGSVPNSATTASLAAGSYSFDAVYGGDSDYSASPVSSCEPFSVTAVTAGSVTTPTTPPATSPATAAPTKTAPSAIAFTGADLAGMWAAAMALLGLGGLLVLTSRRRKGRPVE